MHKKYNLSTLAQWKWADIISKAEWVKIRPGTDTALMLDIAYILEIESLADRDFLNKYCNGYDKFVKYKRYIRW